MRRATLEVQILVEGLCPIDILVQEDLQGSLFFFSFHPLIQMGFIQVILIRHVARVAAVGYMTDCVHQPVGDLGQFRIGANYRSIHQLLSRNDQSFRGARKVPISHADPIDLGIAVNICAVDMDDAHIRKKSRYHCQLFTSKWT